MENISNKMGELIKINVDGKGRQTTNARELHEFLKVEQKFSDWIKKQLENVDAIENIDFRRFPFKKKGNNATLYEYEITLEIAKEICMICGIAPRTNEETKKLSKQARQYFIVCEKKLKEQPKNLSPLDQLALQRDAILQVNEKVDKLESSMPLFSVDCKELQALVKKVGISALGGKDSAAYKDKSIRTKVYSDIQKQIRRQFGVSRYEAIRHTQLSKAIEIVKSYELPYHLKELIGQTNNQLSFS